MIIALVSSTSLAVTLVKPTGDLLTSDVSILLDLTDGQLTITGTAINLPTSQGTAPLKMTDIFDKPTQMLTSGLLSIGNIPFVLKIEADFDGSFIPATGGTGISQAVLTVFGGTFALFLGYNALIYVDFTSLFIFNTLGGSLVTGTGNLMVSGVAPVPCLDALILFATAIVGLGFAVRRRPATSLPRHIPIISKR